VLDEVAEWQNRPLDICYPLVFFGKRCFQATSWSWGTAA
jgi:transposase-like protein